jgi:hypothetical protein
VLSIDPWEQYLFRGHYVLLIFRPWTFFFMAVIFPNLSELFFSCDILSSPHHYFISNSSNDLQFSLFFLNILTFMVCFPSQYFFLGQAFSPVILHSCVWCMSHLRGISCCIHPSSFPSVPTGPSCSYCCHIYSMSFCSLYFISTLVSQGQQFSDLSPFLSTEFIYNLQSKQFLAVSLPDCDL